MSKRVFINLLVALISIQFLNAQVSALEKEALNTLYNDTDGDQWFSQTDANPNNDWDFSGAVTSNWHGVTVANGHVVELDLRSNNLNGILSELFGDLNFLSIVFLFDNEIAGNIPNSLTGLTSLTYLSLSSNNLEGSIPDNVSNLVNLNTLFLGGNRLTGAVPDLSSLLFLQTLSITVNEFHFGDFEQQFNRFNNFSDYRYNVQAKVNEIEDLSLPLGSDVTLNTLVRGSQNHYKWYKDGVLIPNAPDSPSLNLTNLQLDDAGIYHTEITSDIVAGLTLVRNDITLTFGCNTTPIAEELPNVIVCKSFKLPELNPSNTYYSEPDATGLQFNAGDEIFTSQTIYIYTGFPDCSDESSFLITIDNLVNVDSFDDLKVCEEYVLPSISNGNYFTQSNGSGMPLSSGDILTVSQTIYVYLESGSCSDEKSFNVEIQSIGCSPPLDDYKISFPKFFTPNNDGNNDIWKSTHNENDARGSVYIFDRYGKLITQIESDKGFWDGKFKGLDMPSSDYWYRFIHSETGDVITGHFALKR